MMVDKEFFKLRETFLTPYDETARFVGKRFAIVGMVNPETYDREDSDTLFVVEFEDGERYTVWPEEIFEGYGTWAESPGRGQTWPTATEAS